MLRIACRWVTLVLATILRSHMTDDEAGGGEVAPVRDDHSSTPLPVIGDDLPIVVPEHEWRIEVERTCLYDAGQVDGWTLLNVSLLWAQNLCLWLNDSKKHSMFHVRCCAYLENHTSYWFLQVWKMRLILFGFDICQKCQQTWKDKLETTIKVHFV